MKGIFHPDRNYYWEEEPWPSPQEIRNLDPKEDRRYLEHIVQYARGTRQKLIMKKLGITELPEKTVNPEDPSESDFLFDVCRACNEGDEVPHVFPANRKACARLAEEVPGYAAAFDKLQACVQIDTKV
jgi:hypothetical protein